MILQSYCHTSVTSDDMVTVIVTEKDIESSGRMISYNMYNTYIDFKVNTWLFRVG